jgi:hypothetical protein
LPQSAQRFSLRTQSFILYQPRTLWQKVIPPAAKKRVATETQKALNRSGCGAFFCASVSPLLILPQSAQRFSLRTQSFILYQPRTLWQKDNSACGGKRGLPLKHRRH